MTVTFLYHSAFLVELRDSVLLFDWYGGPKPELPPGKTLYVFASHQHGDHYSPNIFTVFGMENVYYILGSDITLSARRKASLKIDDSRVFRLGGDKRLELGPLQIRTLHSTDEGVAFLIKTERKTIYHAGDLHWWHWAEEPGTWNADMEREYKGQCALLEGEEIDVAFLVLDPRQEEDYWLGFDWAMRELSIRWAFPMHSWEDYGIARRLKEDPVSEPYRDRIVEITRKGQRFELDDAGERDP